MLGGGFNIFLFSPLFGEDFPISPIFFRWVETTNQNVIKKTVVYHFLRLNFAGKINLDNF